MGYERYPRNINPYGDYYNRGGDYGRDYSIDEYGYSSARDYEAAGEIGPGRPGGRRGGAPTFRGGYDRNAGYERPYYGNNASDDSARAYRRDRYQSRAAPDYDYQDRGFFDRAGDEVRSWFGDDEAERRRELDQRYDERYGNRWDSPYGRDADYHHWRRQQISALDRDYDEYRHENRQQFHNEFGSWRRERQGQRTALQRVAEHMEVIGSDGEHVGTVDKVRGDRILLTKSDPDAGGHHHSIPSRWIDRVDDKVTIRKTAADAQAHWRDEERNSAMFGDGEQAYDAIGGSHNLNRSFSGTY